MEFMKNSFKALAIVGSFILAGLLVIGNGIMNVIGLIIGAITSK